MRNSPDELKVDYVLLWVTATEVNAIIKSKLTKHLKTIILLNIYYICLFLNILDKKLSKPLYIVLKGNKIYILKMKTIS